MRICERAARGRDINRHGLRRCPGHGRSCRSCAWKRGSTRAVQSKDKDKVTLVQRLEADGRRLAVAGDGIHDAPALGVADVGSRWVQAPMWRCRVRE